MDSKLVLGLKRDLEDVVNHKILYSRAGGGAGNILLLEIDGGYSFWINGYWEIYCGKTLLCCSDDDTWPRIGNISRTTKQLQNKLIANIEFNIDSLNLRIMLQDSFLLSIYCYGEMFLDTEWEFCMPSENLVYEVKGTHQISKVPFYGGHEETCDDVIYKDRINVKYLDHQLSVPCRWSRINLMESERK